MIDIARVCDRVIVLHGGRKLYDGAVSAGIATHEEVLAKRSGLGDQRQADAPAQIERVQLLNARSESCNDFCTGDDLHVEITLQAKRCVPNARIVVHVVSPALGILGAFASPHKGFSFDIPAMGAVLRFAIRNLPLLVGSYTLRLYLYGPGIADFYHGRDQAAAFKIVGPAVDGFGYGVCHTINFDHDWCLEGSSEVAGVKALHPAPDQSL
jgi:hypothetical protein